MTMERLLQKISDFCMEKVLDSLTGEDGLQRKIWAVVLFFVSRRLFIMLPKKGKIQSAARVCRRAGLACELLKFEKVANRWERRLCALHGSKYEKI